MEPAFEFPGHQLPGGSAKLSPHHKWLATYGTDGKVMLRTIGQMVSNFLLAILQCIVAFSSSYHLKKRRVIWWPTIFFKFLKGKMWPLAA